ncbi:Putative peptidoglycan binding domain-containing protein [Prosthecobacter debontii]|uniref:Putative peptidoglycan binding domain-containing protein n=1 Tax=Prosthecobacter debontii TaxID=48467 RepID=A0A1T4XIB9_9BACT|nr:M15 family metallopeptidase [Prosthecobacter debontii]SKA89332.1 Putative peptidoglycan binding domain-containing protein [Prosthecobacter debontii]
MLPVLRRGDKSDAVEVWQNFLVGQGFDPKGADGKFGKDTEAATIAFQKKNKLNDTGVVDNDTYAVAAVLGFKISTDLSTAQTSVNWPPRPTDFGPTNAEKRDAEFGWFDFKHKPEPKDYEHIEILGSWESDNLIVVEVPELATALKKTKARARIHRKIKDPFLALWKAWGEASLLDRVLTWEGAFNSRFIRNKATPQNVKDKNRDALSNHAWGTAFDINYEWNKLGQIPARVGKKGSVRELVQIANQYGFFWGGHFQNRPDGMHFEWGKWV